MSHRIIVQDIRIYGGLTLLQRLQALEGDLELVGITELGWVVHDGDAQERND